MEETEKKIIGFFENQDLLHEALEKFTLMSNVFMSVALDDELACQYVLRIILKEPGLIVREVRVQKELNQIFGKDARLDVVAEDSNGRIMNIEVQRKDNLDHARRVRFYSGTMVSKLLEKGKMHEELPDQVMIYISETDIWHQERSIYEFEMMEKNIGISANDGLKEIFVNTAIDDGSEIAELMKYFKKTDSKDMSHGELSKRVQYLKNEEGGIYEMCEVTEKLFQKMLEREEMKIRLEELRKSVTVLTESQGWSVEKAMDALRIPEEERLLILGRINGPMVDVVVNS